MNKIKILLFIVLLSGCRDKYELPLRETDLSLLVVEGVLNAGQGTTTITLSRTVKVSETTKFKPVLSARLTVEGKNGGIHNLGESGNGNYTHAQLPLVLGQEYRLRIQADNKEYLSDWVVARKSPEIDSISWKRQNDGLTVYANTHDATNNTRYYKWDYEETWEIRTYYQAIYRWTGGTTIVPATSQNNNSVCWKYQTPTNINVGSTAQLQSDVVSQAPLVFIPLYSDKLSVRYSILVKQQSLTKPAYEFYKLMKSNTESLGTIFDPQPSELRGNIKCISNPAESVIGYLTASSFTEKRIFITYREADWSFPQHCPTDTIRNHPDSIRAAVPGYLPYDAELGPSGLPTYYFMAPANCVDCTTRGGALTRPSYW